jgi:hypothetical protein
MSKDVEVTAAYRLGELNERERIIKLLERLDKHNKLHNIDKCAYQENIIALIKGENK